MFYLKNDRHLILLHRIAALPQNTDLSMVYTYYAIFNHRKFGDMHIFQLKSNDMFYKIEPAWIP